MTLPALGQSDITLGQIGFTFFGSISRKRNEIHEFDPLKTIHSLTAYHRQHHHHPPTIITTTTPLPDLHHPHHHHHHHTTNTTTHTTFQTPNGICFDAISLTGGSYQTKQHSLNTFACRLCGIVPMRPGSSGSNLRLQSRRKKHRSTFELRVQLLCFTSFSTMWVQPVFKAKRPSVKECSHKPKHIRSHKHHTYTPAIHTHTNTTHILTHANTHAADNDSLWHNMCTRESPT
jgi:hypothetical protein